MAKKTPTEAANAYLAQLDKEAAMHGETVRRMQGGNAKISAPAPHLTALKFVKQMDSGPLDPNASKQERQTVQDERVRRQQAAHMAPEDKPRKRK